MHLSSDIHRKICFSCLFLSCTFLQIFLHNLKVQALELLELVCCLYPSWGPQPNSWELFVWPQVGKLKLLAQVSIHFPCLSRSKQRRCLSCCWVLSWLHKCNDGDLRSCLLPPCTSPAAPAASLAPGCATWSPDRMCWRPVLLLPHSRHLSLLPNHWERVHKFCLEGLPDVCPVDASAYGGLPCPLLALGHCPNEVALLFHLCDFLHNHGLPFGPNYTGSSKPSNCLVLFPGPLCAAPY